MRIRLFVLSGMVVMSAATYASSSRGDEPAAGAAFARLKTLAGQWEADAAPRRRQPHIVTEWKFVEGGEIRMTETAKYTRVR